MSHFSVRLYTKLCFDGTNSLQLLRKIVSIHRKLYRLFSVAVFHEEGQSINELLAPYNEEIEYAPYLRFTRQEAIAHAKENYPYMADKSDEECFEFVSVWYISDRNGNLYTMSNPNAKWDWWEIGGRWHNSLRLKDGRFADTARVRDIDFSMNEEVYKKARVCQVKCV